VLGRKIKKMCWSRTPRERERQRDIMRWFGCDIFYEVYETVKEEAQRGYEFAKRVLEGFDKSSPMNLMICLEQL